MRNYYPKRPSSAPLHNLSKLYDVPVGFVTTPPPYFEAVYCFICGRRRVAVARYRMISLVLIYIFNFFSKTAWWISMKLGRDEVLVAPKRCCSWARSAQGWIQGGAKQGDGGSLLKNKTSSSRATATNRIHNYQWSRSMWRKCYYFWYHSEVKFLTSVLT